MIFVKINPCLLDAATWLSIWLLVGVGVQCGAFPLDEAVRKDRGMVLEVRILYTEGCANTAQTLQRVRDVARDMGVAIEIEQVLVTTQEQADTLCFLGSPTVQVGGQDIDPSACTASTFGFT